MFLSFLPRAALPLPAQGPALEGGLSCRNHASPLTPPAGRGDPPSRRIICAPAAALPRPRREVPLPAAASYCTSIRHPATHSYTTPPGHCATLRHPAAASHGPTPAHYRPPPGCTRGKSSQVICLVELKHNTDAYQVALLRMMCDATAPPLAPPGTRQGPGDRGDCALCY